MIIIDEMSMVDIHLMHSLLLAVTAGTRLILWGMRTSFPALAREMFSGTSSAAGCFPVVELKKIFRQASESDIVVTRIRSTEENRWCWIIRAAISFPEEG